MKSDTAMQEQSKNRGKRSHSKIVLYAVLFVLLAVGAIIYKPFMPNPARQLYKNLSRENIRKAIAKQLNKQPEDLTADDFTGLKELGLSGLRVTDITLLSKLRNLEKLKIWYVGIEEIKPTRWENLLITLHI